jgi:hypothetical protein
MPRTTNDSSGCGGKADSGTRRGKLLSLLNVNRMLKFPAAVASGEFNLINGNEQSDDDNRDAERDRRASSL